MHSVPPHSTRRPPARFGRKYGSTFSYFDRCANVSLCAQELGQVQIDCRLRLSKSQWGVLGPAENQAGILYMDLTFRQTKDCRLTSAVVNISLENADDVGESATLQTESGIQIEPESNPRDNTPGQTNEENRMKVYEDDYRDVRFLHFTPEFGPRQLCGEPTKIMTKKTKHLTPNVNVLGNGAGGLGLDQEQTVEQTSRWLFKGNMLRGRKLGAGQEDIMYRTLKWELSEDGFQPQSTHSNVIQTGFTLEHDSEPFCIRIEIQGKLQRKQERFKNNMKQLLRFPSESKKRQGTSMTVVVPDKRMETTRRLDAIARGLPYEMERLNLEGVSVQIPSALPVSFQEPAQISQDQTASTGTAVEENYSGAHATSNTASSTRAHVKQPVRICSFPTQEEIPIRKAATNEILEFTQSGLPKFSEAEGLSTATAPLELPQPQGQLRRGGEPNEEVLREHLAERTGSLKPVRVSPKMASTEETFSQEELNELVSQLAQFPVLLRIFVWLMSMIKFGPGKTPKKNLKGE